MIRNPSFGILICANCGATAKYLCRDCKKLLCGRCRSRKYRIGLGKDPIIAVGICKQCVEDRNLHTAVGMIALTIKGVQIFMEFFSSKNK